MQAEIPEYLNLIEAMCGNTYSPEEREYIQSSISGVSVQVMNEVAKEIEQTESLFLPKPKQVVAITKAHAGKIRYREELAAKPKESSTAQGLNARMCHELMKLMNGQRKSNGNRATRQDLLDALHKAHEAKPNAGWLQVANSLEKNWKKYRQKGWPVDRVGLDMDQHIGSHLDGGLVIGG